MINLNSCEGFRDKTEKVFQWELVRGCNYSCSYCSVGAPDKSVEYCIEWGKVLNTMSKIVNKTTQNINLRLWGGEPTLHPEFKTICDNIEIPFTIYTNLSNNKVFDILDHKHLKYILCSLHLEQVKDLCGFIDKVRTISKLKHVHLNVMLENNFDEYDLSDLDTLENVKVVFKPIDFIEHYYDDKKLNNYKTLIKDCQKFLLNDVLTTRFDILNKKIGIKKFVRCDINKFFNSIDLHGNFYTCLDKTKPLKLDDNFEKQIICSNSECVPYMLEYGVKKRL